MVWYFCVPAEQGNEPGAKVRRANAYKAALARKATPGTAFGNREQAEDNARRVSEVTRMPWIVKEVRV